jgi:leucyl-tRNA synthetase
MRLLIQVNGRVATHLEVPSNIEEPRVHELVREDATIRRLVGDRTIRKIIYVPGTLVNVLA